MKDDNAQALLAKVMGWKDEESVSKYVPQLQLLADYKYDGYQRFGPGKHFIESLALWLNQFKPNDRPVALNFVMRDLIYLSDPELSHLVQIAYRDVIVQERLRLVAEELDIPSHHIGRIKRDRRFEELRKKSLYLGLSDGARTNELRRAAEGEISNEHIWQAYELGDEKASDMLQELKASLADVTNLTHQPRFNLIWLLDDFSGSGNTYIRYDHVERKFKGKIKKVYERLHQAHLVDPGHYEVFLLLYAATRQALDHIDYWAERFTLERGFKPLQSRALWTLEYDSAVTKRNDPELQRLIAADDYYDPAVFDKHFAVGGTRDAKLGFAACALPLVLPHNTPNNSVYVLWGPEINSFVGLFPRVSRHREF